ncbi:hypothetical protein AB5N19_02336 [Seiridium cardinale]
MLSKRLEELSKDPDDRNSIAELVVTALGTQGSYYLCWKTKSGQYQQDGHGLPIELQDWLFPTTGPTRNFESLQVILGPREGDFVASDCNGRVERKVPEQLPRPLERARTFKSYDGTTVSRPLSMAVNNTEPPNGMRQRRSATVGSPGPFSIGRRASLIDEEPVAVPAGNRQASPRLASLVPVVGRINRFRRRPTSLYHTGVQPLVTVESLQATKQDESQHPDSSGGDCERLARSLSDREANSGLDAQRAQKPIGSYVDAGVQMDGPPTPKLPPIQTTFDDYRHIRHVRESSSASSTSSVFTSYSSAISTRRSSVAEDCSLKPDYRQPFNYLPNPVFMGRMQDYFRASGYRLGDALQYGTVS